MKGRETITTVYQQLLLLYINNCYCCISTTVIAEYQQLLLLYINNFNNWRSTTETIEDQQLKQLKINNWNNIFKQIVNKLLLFIVVNLLFMLSICCSVLSMVYCPVLSKYCLCCLCIVHCCLFVVHCCEFIVYVVYLLSNVVYGLLSTTIKQSNYQKKVKRKISYKHCKHLLITYQKAIKTQWKTLWNYNLKALVLPPETHGFTA